LVRAVQTTSLPADLPLPAQPVASRLSKSERGPSLPGSEETEADPINEPVPLFESEPADVAPPAAPEGAADVPVIEALSRETDDKSASAGAWASLCGAALFVHGGGIFPRSRKAEADRSGRLP
jgi:hypothetical protein